MRTALITGVAGQDGAYLARQLLAEGTRVVGLKLPGPIPEELIPFLAGAELVDCDITDQRVLSEIVHDANPDEIYNLAGISSVARSWDDPVRTLDVNACAVMGLLQIVSDRAATGHETRFVQASSAEIFGEPIESPQRETTALRPQSPYGLAKACAHQAVGLMREARSLHASALILYNHESPIRPLTFVTRKITSAAAAISLGLQDSLVLGNIEVSRDWGFAGDYVDAMVRAARTYTPGDYVVATGELHSLRELVAVAFDRVGIDDWETFVRTDQGLARPTDTTSMVGDGSKAADELDWRPTMTFRHLVETMVDADLEQLKTVIA